MSRKTAARGSYLRIEYIGDNPNAEGNYRLCYDRKPGDALTVEWLNINGHGMATRDAIEISQKSSVEVTKNGAGAYIVSEI